MKIDTPQRETIGKCPTAQIYNADEDEGTLNRHVLNLT